jgi:hypothetical protein
VKVVPVANESGSAPKLLIEVAKEKEQMLDAKPEFGNKLWFVVDTDRWGKQTESHDTLPVLFASCQ